MKKLLAIIGALGLTATTASTVVACGPSEESLSGLSVAELQKKLDLFVKKGKELAEKIVEVPVGSDEYLQILDEMSKNSFEMTFFVAQVFLQTNYAVEVSPLVEPKILEGIDEAKYQEYLSMLIELINEGTTNPDPEWNEKYQSYINTLKDYQAQLEAKLKPED